MPSISACTIARNILMLDYPLDRIVQGVEGLVNSFVISVDPKSDDFSLEHVHKLSKRFPFVRVIENVWDMSNITNNGAEFSRQTNLAFAEAAKDSEFTLYLQCDEAVSEADFDIIREHTEDKDTDAWSLLRLYFFGSLEVVRSDWSIRLVRLFRSGTRYSIEDAHDTAGSDKVKESPALIYHYSRIAYDPLIISKRIRTLDSLFHPKKSLIKEEDLEPYSFETYNFDCMHKENVDVGRKKVEEPVFVRFTGTHPKPFRDYK